MDFECKNISTLQYYCRVLENRIIEKDKYIAELETKLVLKNNLIKKLMREGKGEECC